MEGLFGGIKWAASRDFCCQHRRADGGIKRWHDSNKYSHISFPFEYSSAPLENWAVNKKISTMSLIMCTTTTSNITSNNDNNNNKNITNNNESDKGPVTIYRCVASGFICTCDKSDLIFSLFRCPIASLDCMEEFTGHSHHIDYGKQLFA